MSFLKRITRTGARCLFFLGLAFNLPITLASGAVNSVSLHASYKQTEVDILEQGHEFLVLVKVNPTAGAADLLYGASIDLVYDPQFLEVIDAIPLTQRIFPKLLEGDLLNEGGTAETFLLSALVNNQPGRVTIGLARKGPVEAVTVSDEGEVLVSVYFRSLATTEAGETTAIGFGLAGLRDDGNLPIAVDNWQGDAVSIVELIIRKLDLNDDEVIDLKDLILAMQVQTRQPLAEPVHELAEFSGDGIIGMAEAVGIMQVLADLRNPPQ
ncbi:MAG: hypothetical protein KAV83_09380 [Desulfobacterales bacterium]|nr:hypothetical protein [Desulfobacterales bacterium]